MKKKTKILIDENIPYAIPLFSRLGDVKTVIGRNVSMSDLHEIDALIIRSTTQVNKKLLNNSQIKFVGTTTSGSDHIDKNWLKQAGINYSSAPGCNSIAVVEYIFSVLLWLSQRDGFNLRDKTVGIIGVGKIGSCLKKRLNIIGVRTLLCDPPLKEKGSTENFHTLEQLVSDADILTFHIPLIKDGKHATWHLMNKDVLSALPSKSIIINSCRGAIIDNVALLQILKKNKHLTVILDVWENEPHILLPLLDYVDIGTPHIAGYTLEGKLLGTIQVFNAYSAFIGSEMRISLKEILPQPTIQQIQINGKFDEKILRLLVHLIYDVRNDNMKLTYKNKISYKPNTFDYLRKYYFNRREWSSLCVKINNDESKKTLQKLGFSV